MKLDIEKAFEKINKEIEEEENASEEVDKEA